MDNFISKLSRKQNLVKLSGNVTNALLLKGIPKHGVRNTSSVVAWTTSLLLLLQYCFSPVICWQWQAIVRDVFLIILHSLNTAVTIVDARMHTKLLCHVKIKQKHFKEIWNLWSLFLRNIEILLFVVVALNNWNCSTATCIKTHCRTKHHPSKLKKKAKKKKKKGVVV